MEEGGSRGDALLLCSRVTYPFSSPHLERVRRYGESMIMASGKIVAVVGSRGFTDYTFLTSQLDAYRSQNLITKIVSGGATGADRLAARYAREKGIPLDEKRPNWNARGVYNPKAGLERNTEIVAAADVVIAFWDGSSPGTRDTIRKARKMGKEVIVHFTGD